MEDIKNTPDATKVEKHKKRGAGYWVAVSAIIIIALGAFVAAGYWVYDTYMSTPDTGVIEQTSTTKSKTADEKDLENVEKDLESDASLSTDELEKETQDLNSIDTSGI